jgi:hypothetical protein
VTRFQLRTASASEAVFSPPYVPPRPEGTRSARRPAAPSAPADTFPEPIIRQKPPALPPPTRSRELPRPPAPTRAFELPPPLPPKPEPPPPDRPETRRSEPGTWREIIARFERDIDDAPAARTQADEPAAAESTGAPADEPEPVDATAPSPATPTVDEPDLEEPSLDHPVPWEIDAMTTPDYEPTHSIHDPEHDSWPVDADVGDAVPAWSDETDDEADRTADDAAQTFGEIGELLLDEVVPVDPWDVEAEPDDVDDVRSDFPLDAFIVPAGVQNVGGYDDIDVARQVAHRLDELARQLRAGGLRALGSTDSVDELSRVLAAIVTGYLARHG